MDFVKKEFLGKILFMPESTEGISEDQTTAMSGEKQ